MSMKNLICFLEKKSKFMLLPSLLFFFSVKVTAYDFESNGIYYNLESENTVSVARGDSDYEGHVTIPETVIHNDIEYTVSTIGDNAFYECVSLLSIDLPGTLTSIGNSSFFMCSSMISIDFPNSLTSIGYSAFGYCFSLLSIALPDSLTSIGNWAFENCRSLVSVDIPDSITSIGDGAFGGCQSLTTINVSKDNLYFTSLNGVLFDKDKNILYQYAAGLDDTDYTVPDSVISIGNFAFEGCDNLISVYLPDTMTSIGDFAFDNCNSLKSINIPDSLTTIGPKAFEGCSSLISIELPDSLTIIGNGAFQYCRSLVSIELPEMMTSLEDVTFYDCSSLILIDLPDSLTSIGRFVFFKCSSLVSIDFPDSLTFIGEGAFNGCSSLKEVISRASDVPELGDEAFAHASKDAILYVYDSVLEDYKNSDWAQYFSEILPIQEIVEVNAIEISPEGNQELKEDESMAFAANVIPENATDQTVVWTTNNNEVIYIEVSEEDPNEVIVTALEVGETVLTATATDGSGVYATVNITVSKDEGLRIAGVQADSDGFYNVYRLSGELILSTKDASGLKNLEKGMYIINGRTIMR